MAQRISGTPGILGDQPERPPAAATAADTSADNPWPVSLLAHKMKAYIDRMSTVWVEGQIIELSDRANASYLTLHDTTEDISLPVQIWRNVRDRLDTRLTEGSRVVVQAKANYWLAKGRLTMQAYDVRAVGLGELLARLEQLKQMLGAEGLFDPAHKKPLPFLPSRIGLITGHDSDAMKDVLRNASLRWPAVAFEVRNAATQGTNAVPQVMAALEELDAHPDVDVIVIARGGGSLEDLLPFSNEALVRAVHAASTPVVSAIGHEADRPLLDDVADMRASTPTDAAKRIVPDVAEEQMGILQARASLNGALDRLLQSEARALADVRGRPVLAQPETMITGREQDVSTLRARSWQAQAGLVGRAAAEIEHLRTQVRSLSPLNTLARGYAVVQTEDGAAVRSHEQVDAGDRISIKLASGRLTAQVDDSSPDPQSRDLGDGPRQNTDDSTSKE
ncbi:exodeoxyribonuclease VII large subunit [Brevibacterium jeotgali]|uniref:Exodeoxyribonuclease 7 large subunit n=1 Tax=Brevibacterium jeotgali TaxID=1262550 RepID=A0A2H1L6F8_9MICO|nr:exodeoxyribonuclease VII large subunit [Brevibacterium jeotgali]TWC03523.1 exodeoxyribonuclease VII large subunit [Brevibacterium jeotgali]SMY12345.1 Exodeoxyribonuclease VII large subunit [Brevibacterium jeotgali]